ncbi:hypothetical protein BUALT_Bualt04G0158400 [Buddleja alternifolia]|uniref:CASP-like protein n=1 Tax=Buddleja alternifolia TaxID=168488 RepID=A0AAV6XRF6_9LAMI|nr:hypothetical protein BUALT_Bualt04G0158400 [Buddleja alternifolia]
MDNQDRRKSPPAPAPPTVSPPLNVTAPNTSPPYSGEHISLSPPLASPANSHPDSYSSPLHSKQDSGDHISLSPARSSLSSDQYSVIHSHGSSPENTKPHSPEKRPPPATVHKDVFKEPVEVVNRVVLEDSMAIVKVTEFVEEPEAVAAKTDPGGVHGGGVAEGGGSGRRRYTPSQSILRRRKREKMLKKAALGFRVFGFLFCLISFSVMAADRNQGWALDSFERYKEFRYCMSVNVIGFVYSGAQAFDLSYNLATGKYVVQQRQQLRHYFDFAFDQASFKCFIIHCLCSSIIAYLLISASSSAAIRIDDWQSNWGKDTFPDMATASISMSFLAFVAIAFSSLISGYALCTSKYV